MSASVLVFLTTFAMAAAPTEALKSPLKSTVQKIDLDKDLKVTSFVDLYEVQAQKKNVKLSPLSQLKNFELHLQWKACTDLAPKVFASNKDLRGWIALTWLHCASEEKSSKGVSEAKALDVLAKNQDLFREGPWTDELAQLWISRELARAELAAKNKDKKAEEGLERVLALSSLLSKEQKSLAYQLLGDRALAHNDYGQARFFYEEAQTHKDSKYLNDKLEFIAKTQNRSVKSGAASALSEALGEDGQLEERIRQLLKQSDLIPALKDIISLLNQYPGGRSAKRLKDKPLDIYNSLTEGIIKDKALNEMKEADATRLNDWAQSLHRRLDYVGALALAQKAYEKSAQSPSVVSSLWVAGRSAHFLGKYDEALDFYNKLIVNCNGSDEAAEALFRSSLIYFRKKDYTSAAALLERLLQQGRDRYELTGQYWLVRALEKNSKERAQQIASKLTEKYPFSYYGLRLRGEAAGGKLTWPEVKEKVSTSPGDIYLVGPQKNAWARFVALSEAGWMNEAHRELQEGPALKDPTLKAQLAQKLAQRHQYFSAIRMLNEALEADPQLRREEYIKWGFPEVFPYLYQKESAKYGIDVVLLRSLTRQESGFNMRAVSTSNALGLMQMIPPTAQEVAKKLGLQVILPEDMFRPETNIPMGAFYVSQMLDQFHGNVPFALAAYNAGPHRLKAWMEGRDEVQKLLSVASSAPEEEIWIDELPWNETSFYVKAILRNVLIYKMLGKQSYTLSPVLWQDLLTKRTK